MEQVSRVLILILLVSSALAFRVPKHRIHKKDGHSKDTKPAPIDVKKPPIDPQPVPIEGKSAPVDGKPAPVDGNPAPVDGKPAPVDGQLAPIVNVVEKPQDNPKADTQEDVDQDIKGEYVKGLRVDNQDTSRSNNRSKTSTYHRSGPTITFNDDQAVFYAKLASDVEVSSGSPIVFDLVEENVGGLYFGTSGQFGCPDTGTYVFLVSLHAQGTVGARGLGALAFGGENIRTGPKTSFHSTAVDDNGNSQMLSVVQCRTSPLTAVIARSTASPTPTYSAGMTSFAGFRLASASSQAVGFTAELSYDVFLYPGGRIMFDKMVSNVGGHYDSRNGFFRCPDAGIYSFTVSTHYPQAGNMWSVSRLMRDGVSLIQGPITYRATTVHDSGSSSVTTLVQCLPGQDLYVEAERSYTFASTQYGADLTSFSGFRICLQCDGLEAFSAVLTQNITVNDADVAFGNVLFSRGTAYSPLTGIFRCPDSALYLFQWSATAYSGPCNLDLFLNDGRNKRNPMTTQTTSHSSGTTGTSSQFAVIRCSPAARVSLRGNNLSSTKYLLAGHTSFSGYRLPGQ